jgi:hypothetical protein
MPTPTEDVRPTTPRLADRLQLPERPQPEFATQDLPSLDPSPNKPTESPADQPECQNDQDDVLDPEAHQVSEIEPEAPDIKSSTCLVPPQVRIPADIPAVIPSSPPALPTLPPTVLQPNSPSPILNEPTPPRILADSPVIPSEYVDIDQKAGSQNSTSHTPDPVTSPPPSIKSEILQDEPMPEVEAPPEEPGPAVQEEVVPNPPPAPHGAASVAIVEAPVVPFRSEGTARKEPVIPASRPKRVYIPNGVFARNQFLPWPFHVLNEDEHKSAVLLIEVYTIHHSQLHSLICSTLEDVSLHSIEL